MRLGLITLLVFFILNLGVDFYIFRALMSDLRRQFWCKIQFWSALIFAAGLIVLMFLPINSLPDKVIGWLMWVIFGYIAVYLAKYTFFIFDIFSRIPLLCHHPRWKWLSVTGAILGLGGFCWLWWSALYTRFTYDVKEVDVIVKNLPENFNGFKIVQISDLHLGTYSDDTTFVSQIVGEINSLKPDIVLFTGDIVNRSSEELKPFISTLSNLHAPYGVYSILGNHDYGDYKEWPDENAKAANLDSLVSYQKQMGWNLMRNETAWLVNEGDSIALIGVENVGDPPFHTYGDLSKAYKDTKDNRTKILLSHNPAHWHKDIRNSDNKVDLTLSGHTHAMQFEIFGWSPISFRYNEWGGLYVDDRDNQIYVNIGLGTVGFPARVGATPEITLLTLKNGK